MAGSTWSESPQPLPLRGLLNQAEQRNVRVARRTYTSVIEIEQSNKEMH